MIRSQRYKYRIYDSGENRESLVDMENDPGEMRNLAHGQQFKKVLDEHRQLLKEWIKTSGDTAGRKYVWDG